MHYSLLKYYSYSQPIPSTLLNTTSTSQSLSFQKSIHTHVQPTLAFDSSLFISAFFRNKRGTESTTPRHDARSLAPRARVRISRARAPFFLSLSLSPLRRLFLPLPSRFPLRRALIHAIPFATKVVTRARREGGNCRSVTKRAAERLFRYAAGRFFFPFVFPFFLFINVCIREQRVVTLDTGAVGDCGLGSILTFVTAARGGRLLYTNLGVYNRTRARVYAMCVRYGCIIQVGVRILLSWY